MNTPSYNVLLNKEKLIKTVQELCEDTSKLQSANTSYSKVFKVTDDGGLYVYGVGGYDGTNEDDPEVKTLQEVLEG